MEDGVLSNSTSPSIICCFRFPNQNQTTGTEHWHYTGMVCRTGMQLPKYFSSLTPLWRHRIRAPTNVPWWTFGMSATKKNQQLYSTVRQDAKIVVLWQAHSQSSVSTLRYASACTSQSFAEEAHIIMPCLRKFATRSRSLCWQDGFRFRLTEWGSRHVRNQSI